MKKILILLLLLTATAGAQVPGPGFAFWKSAGGTAFDPAALDSIKFMYEVENITETDGDTMYLWPNAVTPTIGAGHLNMATDSKKPVYRDSSGIKWVRFDGIDDEMTAAMSLMSQPMSYVIVYQRRAGGSGTYFDSDNSGNRNTYYWSGVNQNVFAGTANNPTLPLPSADTLFCDVIYFNGAGTYLKHHGLTYNATATPGTNGMVGITVGAFNGSTVPGNIKVYAFYGIHRELTVQEISDFQTYCNTKYSAFP